MRAAHCEWFGRWGGLGGVWSAGKERRRKGEWVGGWVKKGEGQIAARLATYLPTSAQKRWPQGALATALARS